jgi:hypothetical protein
VEVGDSDKMALEREEADFKAEDLTRPREGATNFVTTTQSRIAFLPIEQCSI